MSGPMTSTAVKSHLDVLATTYPTVCTRSTSADWLAGRAGATSGYVKVAATGAGLPTDRWAVLLTGGVHARELAPPDALVSFLEKMLTAYAARAPISYPSWTDPVGHIVYDSFTIPWPWVRKVVEQLDLYVAPLVNPDGRDFVLTVPAGAGYAQQQLHKAWRKNRRPAPSGNSDPLAVGVDINRNFDILWNFPTYYTSGAGVQSSTDPTSDVFIGPNADGPEAEPETKNVANLMRNKGISYYIDFHSYGRDVLFSWGIEENQSTDASQNFANPAYNGRRDGVGHTGYAEYIPSLHNSVSQALAKRISDMVLAKAGGSDARAQARSKYEVKPSSGLYVTSGSSDDYLFSRWFTQATHGTPIREVFAYTIEVGGNPDLGADFDEGGFTPDYITQYPKLERESTSRHGHSSLR